MNKIQKIRHWIAEVLFKLAERISPTNDIWETVYKHSLIFGTGMVVIDPKKIFKESK